MLNWKKYFFSISLIAILSSFLHVTEAVAGIYLGSWDLRGTGQLDTVSRETFGIRVTGPSGTRRDYPIGNSAWSLFSAVDTDGKGGAEIVLRAGSEIVIIDHAYQTIRKYPMGNISWAIMKAADLDNKAGDELIVSTVRGVRIITDRNGNLRDIPFNDGGTWSLYGLANLSGKGLDLVINHPGGVRIIDPRSYVMKNYNIPGSSAIYGIASLEDGDKQHVIGRNPGSVYVISGGATGSARFYPISTTLSWAIYQQTADTDGKPGDEVIVQLPTAITLIRQLSKSTKTYSIGSGFTINAVQDMDSRAGKEIIITTSGGVTKIVNDNRGTVQ